MITLTRHAENFAEIIASNDNIEQKLIAETKKIEIECNNYKLTNVVLTSMLLFAHHAIKHPEPNNIFKYLQLQENNEK